MASAQTSSTISLVWSAPSTDLASGADANGYVVYDVDTGAAVYNGTGSTATSAAISGLSSGELYNFSVSALSTAGTGTAGVTSPLSTTPGAPTSLVSAGSTESTVALTWAAPAMSAGSPVTGYVVYERAVYEAADMVLGGAAVPDGVLAHFLASSASDLTVDTIKYNGLGNTSQSATISGLTAGSHYVYVVAAMSAVGVGNKSAALTVSTTPSAPSGLASVAQTASTVNLSWEAPVLTSSAAPVTGYIVYRNDGAGGAIPASGAAVACNGTGQVATTCVAGGLSGGKLYAFSVAALSDIGEGVRSTPVVSVGTALAPPTNLSAPSATVLSTSIGLTWTAPTADTTALSATGY